MCFAPSRSSGLQRNLGAFPASELASAGATAFQSAQTPQSHGSGVFRAFNGRLGLRSLARSFPHDLVRKLIRVTRALL